MLLLFLPHQQFNTLKKHFSHRHCRDGHPCSGGGSPDPMGETTGSSSQNRVGGEGGYVQGQHMPTWAPLQRGPPPKKFADGSSPPHQPPPPPPSSPARCQHVPPCPARRPFPLPLSAPSAPRLSFLPPTQHPPLRPAPINVIYMCNVISIMLVIASFTDNK